jgi:hypothetical protein
MDDDIEGVTKVVYDRIRIRQLKPRQTDRIREHLQYRRQVNQDFDTYLTQLDPWEVSYSNMSN